MTDGGDDQGRSLAVPGRHLSISMDFSVAIVMLEKLDCILFKRAARPIYMRVQVRLNAISPYQSQQSSPAIRDISVSGHTRHLRLRPYETHLRLRPVYAIFSQGTYNLYKLATIIQTVKQDPVHHSPLLVL